MRENIINTPPDSGLGDNLKVAFDKVNAMTLELYAADESFSNDIDAINITLTQINNGSVLNHTHTINQIIGLQTTLNSKVSTSIFNSNNIAVPLEYVPPVT